MTTFEQQRGAASLAALAMIGVVFVGAVLTQEALLFRAMTRSLALFDAEPSPLTCAEDVGGWSFRPLALRTPGAQPGSDLPCLPPRLDHAAPGRARTPLALCLLVARLALPSATLPELKCT